jgi:hypothetical protein
MQLNEIPPNVSDSLIYVSSTKPALLNPKKSEHVLGF